MGSKDKVNVFLAGFQKCATSWLHCCLRKHPEIFVPKQHMLHFFDIHYLEGPAWYSRFYEDAVGQSRLGDTTASYARDPQAVQRIADYNPEARIILLMRNPIDRAFSHYWHEKKKGKIAFRFEEVFENFDLYDDWVRTGFYSEHIERLRRLFADDQLLFLLQDDVREDPRAVLERVYGFLEVDPAFDAPSCRRERNQAIYTPVGLNAVLRRSAEFAARLPEPVGSRLSSALSPKSEYDRGMSAEMRRKLAAIFQPEIARLSAILNRDLSAWQ